MNTDDVDPDRLERVRHNCGVPIPVALRVRHERNLAYTGKCLSQDGQRVLQIPAAARRVAVRKQKQPRATQSPGCGPRLTPGVNHTSTFTAAAAAKD